MHVKYVFIYYLQDQRITRQLYICLEVCNINSSYNVSKSITFVSGSVQYDLDM